MVSGLLSDLVYPELKTTGRLELGSMATAFRIWRHKLDFVLADKKLKYVFTDPIPDKEKTHLPTKSFSTMTRKLIASSFLVSMTPHVCTTTNVTTWPSLC
ncbi:hypothetical protein AB3S75_036787 [Citrus x aurantiifolia]